ncbi:MAG TPA: YigZ family protein [Bacteroidales bacterium]|nr:YigZ family protein [Bacteroidales bacterium]HQB21093.1 YigZ family protein [Bacteroidales bacterium]
METDFFYTIANPSEGIFTEKSSKFLAFAFQVSSEDEVKQHLNDLKKKYFDARHHVYAFIIGINQETYRASDDGEPSNSSGPPVLGQIRSMNLTNTLIVVVRYFGGTKLGVPGLINAYKTVAKNALDNAKIIKKYVEKKIEIIFDYEDMNFVMKVIKDYEANIISQEFQENCSIICTIRLSLYEKFIESLKQNHKLIIKHNEEGIC